MRVHILLNMHILILTHFEVDTACFVFFLLAKK